MRQFTIALSNHEFVTYKTYLKKSIDVGKKRLIETESLNKYYTVLSLIYVQQKVYDALTQSDNFSEISGNASETPREENKGD